MINNEMLYKYSCAVINQLYEQNLLTLDEVISIKKELAKRFDYKEN